MKKTDLIIGFLIGIVSALLGTFLFLTLFTKYNLFTDFQAIRAEQILGKVITLGAILNIIVFFILLQKKKELMARGIVLATITLAILTMFL
ncbi:hypothetical protein [Flavobacterium sp.]|uniref:hypothetical protein n=1 Tax=Flavobacterium sp. TaxID=239 RepID=UPI0037516C67